MTSMCRKCIFHFISNTPVFSLVKAPGDGIKLNVAINTRIEEYIIAHSFTSLWTLRKQNLV